MIGYGTSECSPTQSRSKADARHTPIWLRVAHGRTDGDGSPARTGPEKRDESGHRHDESARMACRANVSGAAAWPGVVPGGMLKRWESADAPLGARGVPLATEAAHARVVDSTTAKQPHTDEGRYGLC
jgi:hypothetical protein